MSCKASCFGRATQCTKAYTVARAKCDNTANRQIVRFLFADTETAENRINHIFRSGLSCYFSERIVRLSEVNEQ